MKILLDYYWQSGCWKREQSISDEDLAIAKSEGYMFDMGDEKISHKETLQRLKSAVEKIDPKDVANAFLYSLSTRRLEYRSALGSYWYAVAIPDHNIRVGALTGHCYYCDWNRRLDKNKENFCRYKFGSLGFALARYALFDLEQFLKMPKVTPTEQDVKILLRILDCVNALSDNDKAGKLLERVVKEKIFPTNKHEAQGLLGILGVCGVLSSSEYPCYCERFVDVYARGPVEHKNDFEYPVNRWRKRDGVNGVWLERVFMMFGGKGLSAK